MRVLILIMIILLPSCSNNSNANKLEDNYSFSKKMTIIEFKTTLGEYAENSPYPNIDE
jgi:hypothetical protein